MVKNAVVFCGQGGLDCQELRVGVLRIPEVTLRLREAQQYLDSQGINQIDLMNFICSEDDVFLRDKILRSLSASIVQIGLRDRLLRSQKQLDFLVGSSSGESALRVCAGRMEFSSLVQNAVEKWLSAHSAKVIPLVMDSSNSGSTVGNGDYQAYSARVDEGGQIRYTSVREGISDLKQILSLLREEYGITRFISIGPAYLLRPEDVSQFAMDEIEILDSIELDPMLGWFWVTIRPQSMVAQ